MRPWLSTTATVVMTLCALIITATVVPRENRKSPPTATLLAPIRKVEDWEKLIPGGRRLGSSDAPVTVVEFADFQCPFCQRMAADLARLMGQYNGRVAVVYRHFPIPSLHPHAVAAAEAAECAGEQGRFSGYHDALFADMSSIGVRDWISFAKEAGVADTIRFRACVDRRVFREDVERDMRAGLEAGVNGTPTLFFGGRMVAGTPAVQLLKEWLDSIGMGKRQDA
jgi:protein-disulfide isomerase